MGKEWRRMAKPEQQVLRLQFFKQLRIISEFVRNMWILVGRVLTIEFTTAPLTRVAQLQEPENNFPLQSDLTHLTHSLHNKRRFFTDRDWSNPCSRKWAKGLCNPPSLRREIQPQKCQFYSSPGFLLNWTLPTKVTWVVTAASLR